jgi:Zn-dependent protease with chaperone function
MGGILVIIGLFVLIRVMTEAFAAAYVKTNGVEVGPGQLPQVYQAVRRCAERLGCDAPTVYVMQANIWNSLAMRLAGRRVVVLLSGAVDSILLRGDMDQLTWLVGHEIGHHVAGHLNYTAQFLELGGWLPWVHLWHSRHRELTCDRIGLWCVGSLRPCLVAVANMTVGAQLASQVNLNSAMQQWRNCEHEFFVWYRTIYTTHPHHLWRLTALAEAAQAFRLPAEAPQLSAGPMYAALPDTAL